MLWCVSPRLHDYNRRTSDAARSLRLLSPKLSVIAVVSARQHTPKSGPLKTGRPGWCSVGASRK